MLFSLLTNSILFWHLTSLKTHSRYLLELVVTVFDKDLGKLMLAQCPAKRNTFGFLPLLHLYLSHIQHSLEILLSMLAPTFLLQ